MTSQLHIQALLAACMREAEEQFLVMSPRPGDRHEHMAIAVGQMFENFGIKAIKRNTLEIWVPGIVRSWGVSTKAHNAKYGSKLKDWQRDVGNVWRQHHRDAQFRGPVSLDFLFLSDRARKDTTNMVKGAEDALQNVAIEDDERVYEVYARKEPATRAASGMRVRVSNLVGPAFPEHL